MYASTLCIVLPVLLVVSTLGFGSLMRTIGILRGWNPRAAFWVTAGFVLFQIVYDLVGLNLLASMPDFEILISLPYYLILTIGILSPPLLFALRWFYRDRFKQSASIRPIPAPNNPPRREIAATPPPSESETVQPAAAATSGHIFISYRRTDSADIAGRIYDRLTGRFGREPIFKDVDSIPLGLDFKEYLDKKVGECDVLLAVIGDDWLDTRDPAGKKRLEDTGDFVRIEIESALQRGIPVIPLLVRGASMPAEESLPQGLRKLVFRNGIPIRTDPDFHRDMDRLIAALEKYININNR